MPWTFHAEQRAWDRYGIQPTPADWDQALIDICAAIEGHGTNALLLKRKHGGIERWLVRLGQTPVIAVYAPAQAMFITLISNMSGPKGTEYQE